MKQLTSIAKSQQTFPETPVNLLSPRICAWAARVLLYGRTFQVSKDKESPPFTILTESMHYWD